MKIKQTVLLLLLPIIWGGYYVASQQAVSGISVFSVGIIIRFITMLLLLVIMTKTKQVKMLMHVKGVLPRLLLIGALGYSLDLTAFLGLTYSSAGIGAALLKSDIIFVNVISVIIYKERFSRRDWIFSLLTLGGVFLVLDIDFGAMDIMNGGNIFFVLSALFVSINAFIIKSVQHDKHNPVSDNVIAFYNNFITMILFWGSALFMGTLDQIVGVGMDKGVLLAVLLAGLGQTLVYVVYYYNLRNNPVWIVKVCNLFMPVVAMLVTFLLFGTVIKGKQFIGIAVVLCGALGILLEKKDKTAENL